MDGCDDDIKGEMVPIEDIKKLGEIYNIPFIEILEIIKKDRELALENYKMFKERMIEAEDDTDTTKEQVNKALDLVIQSSGKLSDLIHSASRLWGDTMKALAIRESKKAQLVDGKTMNRINSSRRASLIEDIKSKEKEEV